MTIEIHLVWIITCGILLVIGGMAGGYVYTRFRYENREEDLSEWENTLKQQRIELQRQSYQISTNRIKLPAGEQSDSETTLTEIIQQRELEFAILEQEAELEQRLLKEENLALKAELSAFKGHSASGSEASPKGHEQEYIIVEPLELSEPETEFEPLELSEPETEFEPRERSEPDEVNEPAEVIDSDKVADAEKSHGETNFDTFDFHWPAHAAPAPTPVSTPTPPLQHPQPHQDEAMRLPTFQSVSSFVPLPEDNDTNYQPNSIRELVELGPDQYELLTDLGYASPEKIASLTPDEIQRVSEIFRIPVFVIETRWIPMARTLIS